MIGVLDTLAPITLDQLDAVVAMRTRADRKHVVRREVAERLVERLAPTYAALEIGGLRAFAYDTVYFDTLLDESAASHIAIGGGFPFLAGDLASRVNETEIHIDFMIGSPELEATGITAQGERVPVLLRAKWAF